MSDAFTALDALLSGAVNAVFGERFQFIAYAPGSGDDLDGPRRPDVSRPTFEAVGQWVAQSKSKTPTARGATQDDNAHNWTAAHPECHIDDNLLQWRPRPFDRVLRLETGETYQIAVPPRPDGMGHTCFQLSARQRT